MTVVAPAHEIGGTAVLSVHLEDLGVAIGLADVVCPDDQTVANADLHDSSFEVRDSSAWSAIEDRASASTSWAKWSTASQSVYS